MAARLQPDAVEPVLQLGQVFGRNQQYDKAAAQFQRALAITPDLADAQFGYAMSLVGLRRVAEARDVLARGARSHPEDPRFAATAARLAHAR